MFTSVQLKEIKSSQYKQSNEPIQRVDTSIQTLDPNTTEMNELTMCYPKPVTPLLNEIFNTSEPYHLSNGIVIVKNLKA